MSSSYFKRGMNERSVFELFVRGLPPLRHWLLVAGLGPALSMIEQMRFGPAECDYLTGLGLQREFVDYLAGCRFTGDVDAMPEGTVAFADEPLIRVTAPRIEAQLLETLLLNQVNHQTAIATKAARIALAAGGGEHVVDFSPRRDHGVDAAMKAARSAAIAGAAGTSNVAAAMRYGLQPSGTMAHSYVLSFPDELTAFTAFMEDTPDNAILLVDTYETEAGVRNAIAAAQDTGVPLKGVRIDSGELLELSRLARELLDAAGFRDTGIIASGDLEETQIARLVAAGAPIDTFGVGTDLGTSRDSPVVGGVYKLVAHESADGWHGVAKRSPHKASVPWPKQVFREVEDGRMARDVVGRDDESLPGRPLLVPAMRGGEVVLRESLSQMRERAAAELAALPEELRTSDPEAQPPPYPVERSEALRSATEAAAAQARG
jgi:nicotinate phosphoribosyltransferase